MYTNKRAMIDYFVPSSNQLTDLATIYTQLTVFSMCKAPMESADKFSQRIMKIYNEMMTIYDTAPNISTLEPDKKDMRLKGTH